MGNAPSTVWEVTVGIPLNVRSRAGARLSLRSGGDLPFATFDILPAAVTLRDVAADDELLITFFVPGDTPTDLGTVAMPVAKVAELGKGAVWIGWKFDASETSLDAALNLARSLRTPKFCLRVATASGLENLGCGQQSRTPRLPTPSSIDDNAELVVRSFHREFAELTQLAEKLPSAISHRSMARSSVEGVLKLSDKECLRAVLERWRDGRDVAAELLSADLRTSEAEVAKEEAIASTKVAELGAARAEAATRSAQRRADAAAAELAALLATIGTGRADAAEATAALQRRTDDAVAAREHAERCAVDAAAVASAAGAAATDASARLREVERALAEEQAAAARATARARDAEERLADAEARARAAEATARLADCRAATADAAAERATERAFLAQVALDKQNYPVPAPAYPVPTPRADTAADASRAVPPPAAATLPTLLDSAPCAVPAPARSPETQLRRLAPAASTACILTAPPRAAGSVAGSGSPCVSSRSSADTPATGGQKTPQLLSRTVSAATSTASLHGLLKSVPHPATPLAETRSPIVPRRLPGASPAALGRSVLSFQPVRVAGSPTFLRR